LTKAQLAALLAPPAPEAASEVAGSLKIESSQARGG
jgi:hypothetical protein